MTNALQVKVAPQFADGEPTTVHFGRITAFYSFDVFATVKGKVQVILTVTYNKRTHIYDVVRFEAHGNELPAKVIRTIPLDDILAACAEKVVIDWPDYSDKTTDITDARHHQAVKELYDLGTAVHATPSNVIAKKFGVHRLTAARWIGHIRQMGILPKS